MVRLPNIWWILVLGAAACGFDSDPTAGSCVQNQQRSCACSGGRLGLHTCRPDSTYGPCVCDTVDAAERAASDAGPDATVAPPDPGTTSGGNAGSPDTAGTGGAAAEGAAGTLASGEGGASGAAGTNAGSSGAAGSGGLGDAGESGAGAGGTGGTAGGDGGEGGAGGTGTAGSDGGPVEPGDPFTRCKSDMDCNVNLVCAINAQAGQTTGYCTAFCDPTSAGRCPQPTSGTVKATCVAFASVCALMDCVNLHCPRDMECVEGGFGGPVPTSYCQYTSRGPGGP